MQNADDKCTILMRKYLYWALFVILCVQVGSIIQIHSLVGQLTICDTILLLLAKLDENPILGGWFKKNASKLQIPFAHVIACVTVQALIFVTLTHSMEVAFCEDSNAHLTASFLAITLVSVSFKIFSMVYLRVHLMNSAHQCMLHLLAPSGIAVLYTVNTFYSPKGNYYLTRLDPLLSMLLCIIISAIVIPLFFQHIPSLLCHSPHGIQIDKFKTEVETNFPLTKCLHLHVFNTYPNNTFDVIMHVGICIDSAAHTPETNNLTKKSSVTSAEKLMLSLDLPAEQARVQDILRELRRVLHKAGAQNVTIQPHFMSTPHGVLSVNESKTSWNACKTEKCSRGKGCCATPLKQ